MGGALRATHRFFMPINVRGMTMTDYRRTRLPGATYFFTVAIAEKHLDLLVRYIQDLKAAFRDEHQLDKRVYGQLAALASECRIRTHV